MTRGARRGLITRTIDGLARNPTAAGGGIVMLVMAAAIITNAVSMQSGSHPSPLFSDPRPVRDDRYPFAVDPATTESIRPSAAIAEQDRAIVAAVQAELRARGFYDGAVDGLSGPVTSAAIMRFEAAAGLPETGEADDTVLAALREMSRVAAAPAEPEPVVAGPQASGMPIPRAKPRAAAEPVDPIGALVASATPAPSDMPAPPPVPAQIAAAPTRVEPVALPAPAPAPVEPPVTVAEGNSGAAPIRSVKVQPIRISAFEDSAEPAAAPTVTATADPRLARIQAALGDLGFGPVAADGVMNEATRAAIADFESYRGLPRTGSVNERVLAELVAIGGLSLNQ